MKDIHSELILQIEGMINIDIGNYLFEKKGIDLFFDGKYDLNIYINDSNYVKPDKYGNVFIDDLEVERKVFIGHYHNDDLLWLLMNYENEKNKMLKRIDDYIKWSDE